MKKTSRRTFAKQVTGAIAALPLASVSTVFAQKKPKEKPPSAYDESIRNHENTPPPIEIQDGSLTFFVGTAATADPDPRNPFNKDSSSATEYIHSGDLGGRSNLIEHLRVLHGSGNMLYQDLNADGSVITITLQDVDGADLGEIALTGYAPASVPGSRPKFEIKSKGPIAANRKLDYKGHGLGTKKDRHELRHKGGPGNKEFRVSSIKVEKGGGLYFFTKAPDISATEPFSQGYRVLAWIAE